MNPEQYDRLIEAVEAISGTLRFFKGFLCGECGGEKRITGDGWSMPCLSCKWED